MSELSPSVAAPQLKRARGCLIGGLALCGIGQWMIFQHVGALLEFWIYVIKDTGHSVTRMAEPMSGDGAVQRLIVLLNYIVIWAGIFFLGYAHFFVAVLRRATTVLWIARIFEVIVVLVGIVYFMLQPAQLVETHYGFIVILLGLAVHAAGLFLIPRVERGGSGRDG